jgi:SAM-dependent methyltransferase
MAGKIVKRGLDNIGRQSYTAYHDYFSVYRKYVAEHDAISGTDLSDCRVLDFGCGYHNPTVALLDGRVKTAAGLDIINVFYDDSLTNQLTNSGVARGLFRYLSSKVYYRYLDWFAHEEPTPEHARPDTYDGQQFPYKADSFDAFYSNGAFHLIDNYEEIIGEIARVVAPDGYVNVNFRNEASLHGYNTPNCNHSAFENGAPRPWAHLRDWDPAELGLFGPDEYRMIFETFESMFDDVHIYLSDRSNHLIKYDADLTLPTENRNLFIWEDGEVTDMVRTETGIDSDDFLLSRSLKIVAVN